MGLPRAPTSIYDSLGINVLKVNSDGSINVNPSGGGGSTKIVDAGGTNLLAVNADGSINAKAAVTGTVAVSGGPVDTTVPEGAHNFQASQNSGSAGVQTILAPGLNVNGLIMRRLFFFILDNTGASEATVFIDTAAPSGINDMTKKLLFAALAGDIIANMPYPMKFPAGRGIFLGNGLASGATLLVGMSWDLL